MLRNKFIDMFKKNPKFGQLTLIQFKYKRNNSGSWLAKFSCDCGNIVFKVPSSVIVANIRHCGGIIHKNRLASALSQKYSSYITGAENRKLTFKLSRQNAYMIFKSPCAYCGEIPNNKMLLGGAFSEFNLNGIDRIDNNLGYVITNIVSCCTFCNKAKTNETHEEFLRKIKLIYENLRMQEDYNILKVA